MTTARSKRVNLPKLQVTPPASGRPVGLPSSAGGINGFI